MEAKEIDPNTRTGFLYSPDSPVIEQVYDDPIAYAKQIHADALHPLIAYVDEDYLDDCHKSGIIVNPWTVNLEEAMRLCSCLLYTSCAHLVWEAYQSTGLDLDSDGGKIVTVKDLANSEYLDVVQVYGVDPEEIWP